MKCKICGQEFPEDHYDDEFQIPMNKNQMCFNCTFWQKRLEEDATLPPHTACMIDGTHYLIGPENEKSFFRGFGGSKFQIEFNDGHRVVTTNLWCQGEPEHPYWKEKFPDNARFERNLKWVDIGGTKHLVKDENQDL